MKKDKKNDDKNKKKQETKTNVKKDKKSSSKATETTKQKKEKSNNAKYIFIYIFMGIMVLAIIALLFVILNDRFSLIYRKPIAIVDIEEYGQIKIELEPTKAPNTVNHFIKLVEDGYYDGKVIYGKDAVSLHFGRGDRGGVINATTSMVDKSIEEGSELDYIYEIDGEFEKNNFKLNDIKHEKYVVSLVRADYSDSFPDLEIPKHFSYDSGSPMFKILFKDAPGMNGNYAAFGKVIEGQEIIDKIVKRKLRFNIETEEDLEDLNEFEKFVKIKSVTVDTFGRQFKDLKLHKQFTLEEYFLKLIEDRF